MFFIGISAHIFIYLLVPALIIVYFYFKGIPGYSETSEPFSDKVICISAVSQTAVQGAYHFNRAIRKKVSSPTPVFCLKNIPIRIFSSPFICYTSPALRSIGLRAPPVL